MRIEINELLKIYGNKTAVNINNLRVNNGEIVGLVGNNGAGKTTLFRLLLDLIKADKGCALYFLDKDDGCHSSNNASTAINPAKSEDWKAYIGAYIDDGFLIDFLTPEEFFFFVGKAYGLSERDVELRLSYFERFMSGEIFGEKKLIRNFSAGNKQKIGIVAAMLNRPALLILDEPFNFLDPSSQGILKRLLVDYNHTYGTTIFLSSHNLTHTVDISTRILLLENGVIVKDLPNHDKCAEAELNDYFMSSS